MLIAKKKSETNIAEYILYMWQLEDIMRAKGFDKNLINEILVEPLEVEENKKVEIRNWYSEFIDKMQNQGIKEKGHLNELNVLLFELNYLHNALLNTIKDEEYARLYLGAKLSIDALKSKSSSQVKNDIEVCLSGLYGLLLLRLRKQNISKETDESMLTFSKMIAYLTAKYHRAQNTGDPSRN